MRTVYKYPLHITDYEQELMLPQGAQIVRVGMQADRLNLWAFGDTDSPPRPRRFCVYGTGAAVPQARTHIGSVEDGQFIWHVFETL